MGRVQEIERERDQEMVVACADLVGRTAATGFQLRYSDDESPTVWLAVATFKRGAEAAAALTPALAAIRLCEQLVDGGTCQHCRKPTMLLVNPTDRAPLPGMCPYQFDPELRTFRRSCEGDR